MIMCSIYHQCFPVSDGECLANKSCLCLEYYILGVRVKILLKLKNNYC